MTGQRVAKLQVHDRRLRWPVPRGMEREVEGALVAGVARRAKYLLFETDRGWLIVHLGMSGSIRVLAGAARAGKHDHVDLHLASGEVLRFTDPRRFGAVLWTRNDPSCHPLLAHLGPEPLSAEFSGVYLYEEARGRKCAVKTLLMDGRIVAGVGNIYAAEALFAAGIRPDRAAGRISLARYERLAGAIRRVLERSVALGGTTLRDFTGAEGRPGYFRQTLKVYGRAGEPCVSCGARLRSARIGQRSTVFCARCQR